MLVGRGSRMPADQIVTGGCEQTRIALGGVVLLTLVLGHELKIFGSRVEQDVSVGPDSALLQILIGIASGKYFGSRHLHAADVEDVFAQTRPTTHDDSGISAISEGQPAAFTLDCRNNVPSQSGFIDIG